MRHSCQSNTGFSRKYSSLWGYFLSCTLTHVSFVAQTHFGLLLYIHLCLLLHRLSCVSCCTDSLVFTVAHIQQCLLLHRLLCLLLHRLTCASFAQTHQCLSLQTLLCFTVVHTQTNKNKLGFIVVHSLMFTVTHTHLYLVLHTYCVYYYTDSRVYCYTDPHVCFLLHIRGVSYCTDSCEEPVSSVASLPRGHWFTFLYNTVNLTTYSESGVNNRTTLIKELF